MRRNFVGEPFVQMIDAFAMNEVSLLRLYLLRAGYLLLVVGLGLTVWPSILNLGKSWELMHGVVVSMLGAMAVLALLGLRYPLQMLPLLFFEVVWKGIWLLRVALRCGARTGWTRTPPRPLMSA
jgi:hypothetical protein